MVKKQVIVLGNDHTNTTGVVQCLGRAGYDVSAVVWGVKTDLVKSSKYCKRLFYAATPSSCIDTICDNLSGTDAAIIACCDMAAIILEQNKSRLMDKFRFEYTAGEWSIEKLSEKDLQVKLAKKAGFNVPWSSSPIETIDELPDEIPYPCITKSLVSCKGSKNDLTIVYDNQNLKSRIAVLLSHTPRIILQQFINHDFEVCIMGCGLKSGEVLMPSIEYKLTQYPKNVGMVCLANIQPLVEEEIKVPIANLIKQINYVGLFSVELMHNKADGKYYFTEINLRNDGGNSFVFKYGVNLPQNHVEDLFDQPLTHFNKFKPGYYIWELHHTQSLVHRGISFGNWLKELRMARGFLMYRNDDKKPFFKQYTNWILHLLRIRKDETYQ